MFNFKSVLSETGLQPASFSCFHYCLVGFFAFSLYFEPFEMGVLIKADLDSFSACHLCFNLGT